MIISSLNELDDFAKSFSKTLKPYDVVVLDGDLGAGKTQLTQYICKHLGVTDSIGSPTFPIVNSYEANLLIFHFDVYRLETKEELQNIGFDDYLNQPAISIIEWGSKFKTLMPSNTIYITITLMEDDKRSIEISK